MNIANVEILPWMHGIGFFGYNYVFIQVYTYACEHEGSKYHVLM